MTPPMIFFVLILLAGFYMSWNIGANDVSNAMGTSVGSKALTLKKAVLLAAILEFSGAFFLGGNVSKTLQDGLIEFSIFKNTPDILMIGMFSALVGTSIWLHVASYLGWPVSTTHAIVGAILGFGFLVGGPKAVHWKEVSSIASSWVISPVLSGIISFFCFNFLQKKVLFSLNPVKATKTLLPYLFSLVLFLFLSTALFNGLIHFDIFLSPYMVLLITCMISLFVFILVKVLIHYFTGQETISSELFSKYPLQLTSIEKSLKHLHRLCPTLEPGKSTEIEQTITYLENLKTTIQAKQSQISTSKEYSTVEKLFAYLQILSASFVAFAHGSNDVANAIGPVAAVLEIIKNPNNFSIQTTIPTWLLGLGGVGIVIGLATLGYKVIATIGEKITELTPTRGFCAEFGAAFTILIASKLSLPISTTHCIVGSVLGVGMAKGLMGINLKVIKEIVLSWIITIPCAALCSIILYSLIRLFVGSIPLL